MDPKVKDEIKDMINHVDGVGLQKTWKNIQDVLSKHNLVSTLVIPCDQIGVHPSNRDGFGVAHRDVHRLLNLVAEVVCAWCIEVNHLPEPMVTKFNEDLVRQSGGAIPAFPHPPRYASLSASHTNQMLRACLHQCPHQDGEKTLTCEGLLDMSRITSQDPALARAVKEGIRWRVVSHVVGMEIPTLPRVIQSANNAAQAIARAEHEFQIFRRISNEVAADPTVKWGDIKAKLLASKPLCALACPHMFAFLSKFGRGHGLIEKVEDRLKSTTEMSKSLGDGFWKAIAADSPKGCLDQFVTWRFALLSVAYGSDFHVLISDVRKSLGKEARERVLEIEAVLQELNGLAKDLAAEHCEYVHFAHDQLVMIGLDRLKQTCIQEVMAEFVDVIDQVTSVRLSNKWDMWSKAASTGPSSSGAAGSRTEDHEIIRQRWQARE